MYIFGEYTQEEEIRSILGIEYNSSNWLLPENFLVEDSHYKIILLKNRKIVYEEDFKQLYSIIDRGLKVKKVEEKKTISKK